ncbi:MAG: ABC transporter ATP-binding protein [Planctomycetaceae bacterium]|nr:ABC transporter ATP-binding protein [Planctomycetaceae bacterium]
MLQANQNSPAPLIDVCQFEKFYDRVIAVRELSFHVKPGQIFGLVGPNGAGKTTTLKALSGMIPPTRGTLTVGGLDVVEHPVQAKRILSYIPDDPQLFSELTVSEHLAFIASVYQVEDANEKATELLKEFELFEKRHATARDLSRGMRQKLAICCAYLHDPQVILFDEPLTGLDPHGIRKVKQTIRDRAAAGAAVIISSHLLAVVEDLCTDILILESGRDCFCGTFEDLRAEYREDGHETDLERIFFLVTGVREEVARQVASLETP